MTGSETIGFIGVGLMGHGMAKNILEKGYALVVMGHRNRAPVDDLVSRGAREAPTPAAMARDCDIVHLCVSASPQVEEVVRGKDGILSGARAGLVIVDTSTSDPNSTLMLADACKAQGVHFVDAPLSRTPKEAEEGTLDTMVGADDEIFAIVEPVLKTWAGYIVRTGPVGTGHKMKLLNNFIAMGYAALYSEALAVGLKSGVSPEIFHEVVGGGRMRNGFYDTFMRYAIERDRDAHRFALKNGHKDLRYLAAMANEAGAVNLLGSTVKNYFAAAEAAGMGDEYVPMLSDFVAEMNGVRIAPDR